ncbi:zinc-finger protein [Didymella glomerata]|uniref:Zinc-finger protein n=1 Tax=Didymella glomerata TaxID=749621 RepID=A0A9W8WSQ3_9PLEO|nr:zinc-finger protein [Didymella glomerata]
MAPTNGSPDPDLDEGFFDSMFTSLAAPLAGSKRDAATLSGTGQREYPAEHVNPQVLCCSHCPEVRPSKRRASAHKVGEFHKLTAESHPPIGTDQHFPDDCFEQFCQDWDPNNDCHFAHSAPTGTGTIFCYDNAPCHFQEQYPSHTGPLAHYETYPCFSSAHTHLNGDTTSTHASTAPTPLLSPSNYTSLESAFTSESSPVPGQAAFANNCFLNISGDHCHIDNSCCHGPSRACGDHPSASQHNIDLWNASIAQGNGLSNGFVNFGLHSQPTSPVTMGGMANGTMFNNQFDNSMMGFSSSSSTSWMLPDSTFDSFSHGMGTSKLDFLASAIQQEIMNPMNSLTTTPSIDTTSILDPPTNTTTPVGDAACVCKWQHAPGLLCHAVFLTASALHKHIKTAHVDNCASCFCQWEGCDASAKDFKQRSKLSRHLLGHAGYRPYACSYVGCDKTFATNQAKDNHERTHTGERPKHERTHQTLRPYRCPHSNCTFKPDCRWENLKRHLRRSGHCPELLVEASEEYKTYRESVRREIDEWHRRNGDEGGAKMSRRKGRGSVGS